MIGYLKRFATKRFDWSLKPLNMVNTVVERYESKKRKRSYFNFNRSYTQQRFMKKNSPFVHSIIKRCIFLLGAIFDKER